MYGNYKGYYKRRNIDGRFQFLRREWFEGKACIDIGCNEGRVTATIAERFQPRIIIGIDKDGLLIDSAQSLVKRLKYKHTQEQASSVKSTTSTTTLFKPRALVSNKAKLSASVTANVNLNESSSSLAIGSSAASVMKVSKGATVIQSTAELEVTTEESSQDGFLDEDFETTGEVKHFPFNVIFARRDVFDLSVSAGERYDTILCFSVTKWIHLHRGDDGIMQFFRLIHRLLRKDGIFILEFQQWNSYKKRKNVSEDTEKTFHEIRILPDTFEEVLTQQLRFCIVAKFEVDKDSNSGFNNRPILILRKT